MTTTKLPVLTDDEIYALIQPHPKEIGIVGVARAIEQAVLERAGADAVRDAALEEAALAILAGDEKTSREGDYMWDADDCARAIRALKGTHTAAVADAQPVELQGVAEAIQEGDGFWQTCSGCHESNEGVPTGPFSAVLQCHLGNGCGECGGIGAVWDTTDYQAMADHMAASMNAAPQAAQLSGNAGELDRVESPQWMTCESRRPWAANSLRTHATEMRQAEKRCRNAFRKDYMGEPARYVADALGEAATAFEARLTAIYAAIAASKGAKP